MMIVIPIILVFYLQVDDMYDSVNLNQARKAARDIVNAAHSVYYIGEPSMTMVRVNLPDKINSINISGREFLIEVETQSGPSDIYEVSSVNITGAINASSGVKKIKVEALTSMVRISEIT
jgi:hypothetical protein